MATERSLDIVIRTKAETDGLKQAAAETAKLTEQVKQAAQPADILKQRKEALKNVVKGLAAEFPLLGRAVNALVNPFTAIATVLGVATAAFANYYRQVQEIIDSEVMEQLAASQLTSLQRLRAGYEANAESIAREIAKIAAAGTNAASEFEVWNKALERNQSLRDALVSGELALEKQNIQRRLDRKEIDPNTAKGLMRDADERAARAKEDADSAKAAARVTGLWGTLTGTQAEVAAAQAGMVNPMEMAKADRLAKEAAERAEKRTADIDKEIAAKEKELLDIGQQIASLPQENFVGYGQKERARDEALLGGKQSGIQQNIINLRSQREEFMGGVDSANARVVELKTKNEEAAANLRAATQREAQVKQQLMEAEAANLERQGLVAAGRAQRGQLGAAQGRSEAEATYREHAQSSIGGVQQESDYVQGLYARAQAMAAEKINAQGAALVQSQSKLVDQFGAILADLQKQIDEQKSRLKNLTPGH